MTEEEIRKLAGRELDVSIENALWGLEAGHGPTGDLRGHFEFSSDITAVFRLVIPAMREKGWRYSLAEVGTRIWCQFEDAGAYRKLKESVPFGEEATGICRAALLALQAEESQ